MAKGYKVVMSVPQGPFVITRPRAKTRLQVDNGKLERLKRLRKTIDRKLELTQNERKATMPLNFTKVVEQFDALLELTESDVRLPKTINEENFHITVDAMLETIKQVLGVGDGQQDPVLGPGDGSAIVDVAPGEIPVPAQLSLANAHRRRRAKASRTRMSDAQVGKHLLSKGICPLKPTAGGYRSL